MGLLQDLHALPVKAIVETGCGQPRNQIKVWLRDERKELGEDYDPYNKAETSLRYLWWIRDMSLVIDKICSKRQSVDAEEMFDQCQVFGSVWEEVMSLIDPKSVPIKSWVLIYFSLDITCKLAQEECNKRTVHKEMCLCEDRNKCLQVQPHEDTMQDLSSVMRKWKGIALLWNEIRGPINSILCSESQFIECLSDENNEALTGIVILLESICKVLTVHENNFINLVTHVVQYLASYNSPTLIPMKVIDNPQKILKLATASGVNIHERIRDFDGRRPLEVSLRIKDRQLQRDVIKALVSVGSDVFDCVYDSGGFVKYKTISTMCRKCPESNVNGADFFSRSPLMYALLRFGCTCEKTSCDCIDKCKLWLDALKGLGAEMTHKDQDGVSAIHLAATCPAEILDHVIKLCDDLALNIEDSMGATPLHYAAFDNNLEAVKVLLSLGAARDQRDHNDQTPLDVASFFGYTEIISALSTPIEAYEKANSSPIYHIDFVPVTDIRWYLCANDYKAQNRLELTEKSKLDSILLSPLVGSFETKESKVIKAEVRTLASRLSDWMSNFDQKLSFSVKLRGSSAESTKVGFPDEFDFSFIMNSVEDPLAFQFASNDDKLLAKMTLESHLQEVCDYDFPLFHIKFLHMMFLALNERSVWQGLRLKMFSLKMGKVGPQATLQWNGGTYRHMTISVDLVPLFPIRDHPHIPLNPKWPRPVDFSGCELCFMLDKHGQLGVSYSDLEVVLMRQLPPAALEAYRFAKAIRSTYVSSPIPGARLQPDQLITSFFLKNTLMHVFIDEIWSSCDTDSIPMHSWVRLLFRKAYKIMVEHRDKVHTIVGEEILRSSYPTHLL